MVKQIIFSLMICFFIHPFLSEGASAREPKWSEKKDKHFVIYYESPSDQAVAELLLRKAEHYYRIIGDDIGYSRTNRMWTWDNRVQIFLFATQESFLATTGQPLWSTGYADRDSRLFKSKTIITFTQETNFTDELLPHEISHLILHDFVSDAIQLPIWFDEGVAQMQEKNKRMEVRNIMKILIQKNLVIPFAQFVNWDIRRERDPLKAQIFYAQSLGVVDFLITRYGKDAFARLCRALRDKNDFEKALSTAYSGVFEDYQDLEHKWVQTLK